MSLSNSKVDTITLLAAAAVDRLSLLVYANTKDAQKGRNRPESIISALTKTEDNSKKGLLRFSSGSEFEAARAKLLENLEKEV